MAWCILLGQLAAAEAGAEPASEPAAGPVTEQGAAEPVPSNADPARPIVEPTTEASAPPTEDAAVDPSAAALEPGIEPERPTCVVHTRWFFPLFWRRGWTEVRGDLAFRRYGAFFREEPPPLYVLAEDGHTAYLVVNRVSGGEGLDAAKKPAATLDPVTLEVWGARKPLRGYGSIDPDTRTASIAGHHVEWEGDCTSGQVLVGLLGSRRVAWRGPLGIPLWLPGFTTAAPPLRF